MNITHAIITVVMERFIWNKFKTAVMSDFHGELKSNARQDYVNYLATLQEKNRLLKKMRRKDTGQLQLERREQGFALYLNGANLPTHKKESRTSKTADITNCLGEIPADSVDQMYLRAKTAPSKRKSWSHKSLVLKAEGGDPIQIDAPGILTGAYKDDFEESNLHEDDESGSCDDGEELALSYDDISRLRASLEADTTLTAKTNSPDSLSEGSPTSSCSEELEDGSEQLTTPTSHATQSLTYAQTRAPLEFATKLAASIEVETESHSVQADSHDVLDSCLRYEAPEIALPSQSEKFLSTETANEKEEDDTMSIITKKVKALSIQKQRHLLQILQTLEAESQPPALAPATVSSTEDTRHAKPTLTSPLLLPLAPSRPVSGRTSDLRGEILHSRPVSGRTSDLRGDILHSRPVSGRTSDLRGDILHSRPVSGRTSDLRGDILHSRPVSGRTSDLRGDILHSRPVSGRTSGLRGKILHSRNHNPLMTSHSDSHLPTFLDDAEPDRAQTAVLGRRRHLLNSSTSDLVLLPCVSPTDSTPAEEHFALQQADTLVETPYPAETCIEAPHSTERNIETPERQIEAPQLSESEPVSRRRESADISGCLASITKFDHSHLGQIDTAEDVDTLLEDFLRDYRQKCQTEPGEFVTPCLPSGRVLVLRITSTWGDRHYVGLSGIEIFTAPHGHPAGIATINADPADINVLPEYSSDPRVVANLLDGINRTKDDLHMWLAPYQAGQTITIRFSYFTSIALIRIWNYSKSRIHSLRGVRGLEMFLDSTLIFRGEVSRGASETILFTTSEELLLQVSQHDDTFQRDHSTSYSDESDNEDDPATSRPSTASEEVSMSVRPQTCASNTRQLGGVVGSEVQLVLAASWGDPSSLGLTGLQLLPPCTQPAGVTCTDSGDVQNLFDGENLTTDAAHMWLSSSSHPHTLTLSLATPSPIEGLNVWNYNSSPEDSYSGVKVMHVLVDGVTISPEAGYLLSKAPGHLQYDFAQHISFSEPPVYDTPVAGLPTGFVLQVQLLSTWGDPYYIGLNGIELFDGFRKPIPLTADNMAAYPASVNVLPGVQGDVRTPDKLVDGHYDTDQGSHMWLAPLLPHTHNSVFVLFNTPRCVSGVRLWNYSKTASRGVRDFAVLVDDLLVHQDTLPVAHTGGILPTVRAPLRPFTVWFSQTSDQSGGHQCSEDSLNQRPAVNQGLRPATSVTLHNSRQRH